MRRIVVGLLLGAVLAFAGHAQALAAAADYAFEAVDKPLQQGGEAVISVRLLHKPSGTPVSNAVIFLQRLDMSPDGMADMTSPVTPLPSTEPGVYRFRTDLGMAGRWALMLAAKVPGETETVRGEVILTAK